MSPPPGHRTRRSFLRDMGIAGAAASSVPILGATGALAAGDEAQALAGELCPHPNPIVQENRCTPPATWTEDFRVGSTSSEVNGFSRTPSVDVGGPVELVISGPNKYLPPPGQTPVETAEVEVYRLGHYGGAGGRLIWKTPGPVSTFQKVDENGTPSNSGTLPPDAPLDAHTGLAGRAGDRVVVTVPGSTLTTSGVYLAKIKGRWLDFPSGQSAIPRSGESHVVFVVRDDARPRDLLVLLPSNTWQAYNYRGGRSLYTFSSRYGSAGSIVPATGTERAAKVSLDRPYNNWIAEFNWVLRTEFPAIWWLERHGYDVAYTEDVALGFAPEQLQPGRSAGVAILGHGEYWSEGLRDGLDAARDAGTSIFNFGANTGFWKVRHETVAGTPATSVGDARVLVAYKTIEGGGSEDLATASEADPIEPTSTWRDPGRGPGIPVNTAGATPATYAGPGRPEAELLGGHFSGADDQRNRRFTVPADNGDGEFAGHRAWRHTDVPPTGATIGNQLVGWEWDSIPPATSAFGGARPATRTGAGRLLRLSESDPRDAPPNGAMTQYLKDAGRVFSTPGPASQPAAGESAFAHATTYVAPSGALVFNAGTILWAWGLGPHFLHISGATYADPPTDASDARIIQATTNLLADGGILPLTPEGLLFDPTPTPTPTATPAPTPTAAATPSPTPPAGATPTSSPPGGQGDRPGATPTTTPGPGPTPSPAAPAPLPALTVRVLNARVSSKGRLSLRVEAPAALPRTVRGTVELSVAGRRIARSPFRMAVRSRRSETLSVPLSKASRLLLGRKGSLKPIARVTVVEDGRNWTWLQRITVRPPRPR